MSAPFSAIKSQSTTVFPIPRSETSTVPSSASVYSSSREVEFRISQSGWPGFESLVGSARQISLRLVETMSHNVEIKQNQKCVDEEKRRTRPSEAKDKEMIKTTPRPCHQPSRFCENCDDSDFAADVGIGSGDEIRPAMDEKNTWVYPPRRGGDAEKNEAGRPVLGIR
jgi:hypothetical protein